MNAEIDRHGNGSGEHAQGYKRRRAAKQPPVALAYGHSQGHGHRAQSKKQAGILDPEHAAAQKTDAKKRTARKFVPLAAQHAQRRVEHIRGHGQGKFLGAVPDDKGAAAIHQHNQKRQAGQRTPPFPRVQHQRFHQEKQRRCGAEYFQYVNFQKGICAFKGQPVHAGMQKIQKRPLLLVDIPIEHFAAGNGSTHGKEALGVVPIVDGIEEEMCIRDRYD